MLSQLKHDSERSHCRRRTALKRFGRGPLPTLGKTPGSTCQSPKIRPRGRTLDAATRISTDPSDDHGGDPSELTRPGVGLLASWTSQQQQHGGVRSETNHESKQRRTCLCSEPL